MITSVVQQDSTIPTTSSITKASTQKSADNVIPPHFLIVGKKNALDYIAPALFRIGMLGKLVVRAKGSMSIVTAVNVAEMVKKDVAGLETRSISIGTEEIFVEGVTKRVSYIEIFLVKPDAKVMATVVESRQEKLAETASTAKKIRAKAKKLSTTPKKKTTAAAVRNKKKANS